MTFVHRPTTRKRAQTVAKLPLTPAPSPAEKQRSEARQALARHTVRPVAAQRQAVQAPLRAATLDRQEVERLQQERQVVQAQLGALPEAPARPPAPMARPVPAKPATPDEWVTVLRDRAGEIEGQQLDARAFGAFQTLQRQVAQQLAQGFRADRGDVQVRYASYGEQLATLQRHALSAPVARVVLGMVPPVERVPLQRATDEALQRLQAQESAAMHFETAQALQRQLAELDAEATQPVLARIQARRGGGNPLPDAIRRHLEWGLNHDLSRVRLHDDAEADKLAKGVNAVAFTTGADIFFRAGHFNPNTQSGLELLAHEVTHTVQQSQGRVGSGIDPDAGLEREARQLGRRLSLLTPAPRKGVPVKGRSMPVAGTGSGVQRAVAPAQSLPAVVTAVKQRLSAGQVDQAVSTIRSLPQTQRDAVITTVAALRLPGWEPLRKALLKARLHSPSVNACLAGPSPVSPVSSQTLAQSTAALREASRYLNMDLQTKLGEAIRLAPVSEAFRKQFLSMISLSALAGAAAIFVALQLTPEGWALDALLVVIALATYGPAAVVLGEHLGAFFRLTSRATSEEDLRLAGTHFAEALSILGTAGLAGLIGKAAGRATGRGVVRRQDRGLGQPTAAQEALPSWQGQYTAATRQGLTPWQAKLSATMKVQAPAGKPLQPATTMNAVYQGSLAANAELLLITKTLARRYNLKFQTRQGLKDPARSAQKVNADYGGNAASLLDVAGARLLFDNLDDVYRALAYIRKDYNVVQVKDRFVTPVATGYRDIVLNLRARNGYVVELRLELAKMAEFAAKEHKWYQERRSIEATLLQQNRAATPQEAAKLAELKRLAQGGYAAIWQEATKGRK